MEEGEDTGLDANRQELWSWVVTVSQRKEPLEGEGHMVI